MVIILSDAQHGLTQGAGAPLAVLLVVARTWLSIQVDLVSGCGEDYWPRPGRIFAAARSHRFSELADAIDTAFARWDRAHLHEFVLADGRRIGQPEFDEFDQGIIDGDRTRLSTLNLGEQFLYEFDLGTAGSICVRWVRRGSTRRHSWGSFPPTRCRSGDGERSPINTVAAGQRTMANTTSHPIPA